jgi:putative membrane protein
MDWRFFIPLAAGIAIAFLTLANLMHVLLEEYPWYTYAFFFGLIVASAVLVWRSSAIPITLPSLAGLAVGGIFAFLLVGLSEGETAHSLPVILGSGTVSFCAMILPGISGAFMLLLLGQYEFMLDVLRGFTHGDFTGLEFGLAFLVGGLLGLVVFSRVLSYLLKHYRVVTLSFVIGLMIGALRKPGKEMTSGGDIAGVAAGLVLGVGVVALIAVLESRLRQEAA